MKRYTGQQALYEAISRSRDKAKHGSILEKLRPEPPKAGTPAAQTPQPPTEPQQASVQPPEPIVPEPAQPQGAETLPQLVVELPVQAEPIREVLAEPVVDTLPEPVELSEPAVKPRPVERVVHPVLPGPVRTWLRPRPVQFNEGRIEVSVPYYVGVIAALAVVVVVLTAFRLGQSRSNGQATDAGRQVQGVVDRSGVQTKSATENAAATNTSRTSSNPPASTTAQQGDGSVQSQGDHLIVLTRYRKSEDLEPVVRHFAQNGIDLFILPMEQGPALFAQYGLNPATLPNGSGFLLLTKQLCANPKIAGSDGEKLKQRIAEVGALYRGKAPQGSEPFAPNYFKDAYGMKVR